MNGKDERIKVLFIAGSTRSGSTLLERMLGQMADYFAIGEADRIWHGGVGENWLCGCGAPFRDCSFWRDVMAETFSADLGVQLEDMPRLARQVCRGRLWPFVAWPGLRSARRDASIKQYTRVLARLYAAIHRHAGCEVIVDATKGAYHAFLLNSVAELDVRIIHLVRDSRAVAHSWRRKKLRPEIHWKEQHMRRRSPLTIAAFWTWHNLFAMLANRRRVPYSLLYYDQVVADPRATLERIALQFDAAPPDLGFLDGHVASFDTTHSLGGNPDRFTKGPIVIKADDAWRREMPAFHKLLVTALTLPLLIRFGYFGPARRSKDQGTPA